MRHAALALVLLFGASLRAELPTYIAVEPADLGLDSAADINSHGHVLGRSSTTKQAVIWRRSEGLEVLGGLVGAIALNDHDQVIGTIQLQSTKQAALWDAGAVIPLGSLAYPEPELVSSLAMDVNSHGEVVGFSEDGPTDDYDWRAFYWNVNDGMQDLGTLGGLNSQAFGISDSGAITGFAEDEHGVARPVIWSRAVDGWHIEALGISGEGSGWRIGYRNHVIGEGIYDADIEHGVIFLWNQLSGAIPPPLWQSSCAVTKVDVVGDLNETGLFGATGQVVCEGTWAYLLDLRHGQARRLNSLIVTPEMPTLQRIDRISNGSHLLARTDTWGLGERYILFAR